MTWSFASPDGRATFEFVTLDDEIAVQWRRVGDHDVFNNRDRPTRYVFPRESRQNGRGAR